MKLALTFCFLVGMTAVYGSQRFYFPDQIETKAEANSEAWSNGQNSHANTNSNAVSSNSGSRYPHFYKPHEGHHGGFGSHGLSNFDDRYLNSQAYHPDYNRPLPPYDPQPYPPIHGDHSNAGANAQSSSNGFGSNSQSNAQANSHGFGGNSQSNAQANSQGFGGNSLSNAIAGSQSVNGNGGASAAAAAASAGTSFINGIPIASAAAAASSASASPHGGLTSSVASSASAGGSVNSGYPGVNDGHPGINHGYPGSSYPIGPSGPYHRPYDGPYSNNSPFYREPVHQPWLYRSGADKNDDDNNDDNNPKEAEVVEAVQIKISKGDNDPDAIIFKD